MSYGPITISKAEWDLRPKTKFIRVEGFLYGQSFTATVTVEKSVSPPLNEAILLLEATLENDDGPKKIQPVPFHFADVTAGTEPWTHVQVVSGDESATFPITKISY